MINIIKKYPTWTIVIVLLILIMVLFYMNLNKSNKIRTLQIEKNKYQEEFENTLKDYETFKIQSDSILDSLHLKRQEDLDLLYKLRSQRDSILKSDPKITDKIKEEILKELQNETN